MTASLPSLPVRFRPLPGLPFCALKVPLMPEVGQGTEPSVSLDYDIAAPAPVSSVRSAFGHKLRSSEADTPSSTVPGR